MGWTMCLYFSANNYSGRGWRYVEPVMSSRSGSTLIVSMEVRFSAMDEKFRVNVVGRLEMGNRKHL